MAKHVDDERTNDQGRRPRARLENRPAATHSRRGSSPQNKDEKAKKNKKNDKNQTKKTRKENERNDTRKLDIAETKFKRSRTRAPSPKGYDKRAAVARL